MKPSRIYKVDAFVLKRKNIGEADRLLTIFTKEYGKLRVIAKGIRKITSRRAPHLEIFSRSILLIHPSHSIDIVTESQTIYSFSNLRIDLSRVAKAYYYCELVDSLLPEKQEHRDVFDLLTEAFSYLNGADQIQTQKFEQFSLDLLHQLGYLAPGREITAVGVQHYIESILEKRLRVPRVFAQFA